MPYHTQHDNPVIRMITMPRDICSAFFCVIIFTNCGIMATAVKHPAKTPIMIGFISIRTQQYILILVNNGATAALRLQPDCLLCFTAGNNACIKIFAGPNLRLYLYTASCCTPVYISAGNDYIASVPASITTNMYITSLPDHASPDFDAAHHFGRFKAHNVIFNTVSSYSFCDDHVGCLSLKTVLSGEEWYGINHHRLAVRPGQFLILNNEQHYSCNIDTKDPVKGISVFFKETFAAAVFRDILKNDTELLDSPFAGHPAQPEFFQTLHVMEPELRQRLKKLITGLENDGYHAATEEQLVFFLHYLVRTLIRGSKKATEVSAVKPGTKIEIYKRLCIVKDILHSSFTDKPDLDMLSLTACLSVPQLIRQFKSVFKTTPYQYLIQIRLEHAAAQLKNPAKTVQEISWDCGFENFSAFCRAFKSFYGVQPLAFRKAHI